MKILIGVALVLAVALGVAGYQLRSSWQTESALREQLATATGALAISEVQNSLLVGRFESLDKALANIGEKQLANQKDLEDRLVQLKKLAQEPGDDPQSFACLGMPVPAQLDRWLRQ